MTEDQLPHYTLRHRGRTHFWVSGEAGAIEFWIFDEDHSVFGPGGGVETHYAKPGYLGDGSKSEACAMLNGRPCWHDGTSLWASEHWIPNYLALGEDWVWSELEDTYRDRFRGEA